MPTKKTTPNTKPSPAKAATAAAGEKSPAVAPAPAPAAADPKPAGADARAEAIATLVRGGLSYQDAVAAVDRPASADPAPAKPYIGKDPGADEVIDEASIPDPGEDLEVVEIEHVAPEGYNMLGFLYEMREKLGKSRNKKRFRMTVELDQRLFDWVVYATIAEAQLRNRENLTIQDFLEIKIKELKAADPTGGGRRSPTKSGPRGNFNPATSDWNP